MITENVAGIIDYLDNFAAKGYNQRGMYYNRLVDEPLSKLKLIKDFFIFLFHSRENDK